MAPAGIFVAANSSIWNPAELADVPVSAGRHDKDVVRSGPVVPPQELLIDRQVPAVA
jgi:hypothetical protein